MYKLTIIDYTPLLYKVVNNCRKDKVRGDDFSYYKETLLGELQEILVNTDADYYYCFGDGFTSFRKQKFSSFKANRTHAYLKFRHDLAHWAEENFNVIKSNIFESDDLVALYSKLDYCIDIDSLAAVDNILNINLSTEDVKITIASVDSDMMQLEGTIYWNNNFKTISKEEAKINFYRDILMRGHNNKLDYLEKCGKDTATKYLEAIDKDKLNIYWILKAFISGIDKIYYPNIRSTIAGYGIQEGSAKFARAYEQTYLIQSLVEAKILDEEFKLEQPTKVNLILEYEDNRTKEKDISEVF